MSHPRFQELAMKIVDADATRPDHAAESGEMRDGDTEVLPGLRPRVLGDVAQRHTKAAVHAALFRGTDEAPTIGPYQVLKRLGEGGMGVVYAAYDEQLERKVALKLIRGAAMRRPEGRARTLREARALARLSHPNVVHVYQVGEVDDEIYVAMEFLTGPTLREWLAAQPRSWREVLAVFRQAGEGLMAAHQQWVIHRDFKPANVIVGDDGRVRVLDFGLAHFGGEGEPTPTLTPAGEVTDVLLTQTGAVLGTPAYMAAEQFAGARGDAQTDQFSFCVALYEALYGRRPFVGDRLDELAAAVASGQVTPPTASREVPAWLHRAVTRGLQADPARRWPSMQVLLEALTPPASRVRWGRIAALTGTTSALLVGGMAYVFFTPAPAADPQQAAAHAQAAAQAQAAVSRSQDETALAEASAALTRDPVAAIRALARLTGDDPATWQRARFLAAAAKGRGLPERVLRTGGPPLADVRPLAGGGLVGRDELGAVWRWKMSEGTGEQALAPGAAKQLLVARDVPVWAAIRDESVEVFGDGVAQTIDARAVGALAADWRLASDGRTLVTTSWTRPNGGAGAVYLWDLTRPGAPPRTFALPANSHAEIADDASLVVSKGATGLRVVRTRDGAETTVKYAGAPWGLSADNRFVIGRPAGGELGLDVVEIATGAARRVEADSVRVIAGAEVLFATNLAIRRESLETGAVAWSLPLAAKGGSLDGRLVVDPAHDRFAARVGDQWAIGDLQRGELRSFMTVPKDRSPQWVGADELLVVVRDELRIHRPSRATVQLHESGSTCALAPGARWAVVAPRDLENGEYVRVELATGATTRFACPTRPKPVDFGGGFTHTMVSTAIDDAGQIAMFGPEGWSCWWDEQHGARAGAAGSLSSLLLGLPRGVALADRAAVEVRSGPDAVARRWTTAGDVSELVASPSGAMLAARSDRGVQVLRVDDGAVNSVRTEATPAGLREVVAGAMAWSPDSARLAALDRVEGALELVVWDVTGEPRELERHVLKDSPGRTSNRLTFTPAGTTLALTDRVGSILMFDLATDATRRLELPDLFALHMRGETDAIGIDKEGLPLLVDFAAGEVSPLTSNPGLGFSSGPELRDGADGTVWSCASIGPGAVAEIAPMGEATPQAVRAEIQRRAASL